MNIKILFLTVFCFTSFGLATAQHSIHTQPLSDEIKSIQILVNDDPFLPPIIKLQGDDRITLKFDKLSIEEPRLRYRIFHCTANWQKSDLRDIDFLNGFNNQLIEDYRFSENTIVSYIHYDLNFPNRQVGPKISGNYAIEVYYENAPEDPLLQACFSVTENQVRIQGKVSGNTDFDFNKAHQQISFEISHPRLSIHDAKREIMVTVLQNNCLNFARKNVQPTYIYPNRLVFEHNPDLIFEAGNEYRRFEIQSRRYGGMGVEWIRYTHPHYVAMLNTDEVRANKTRQYDQDQNGRFFLRTTDGDDSDVEADYFEVLFNLNSQESIYPLHVIGDFTYNNPKNFVLHFDEATQKYQLSTLLKQGFYNYLYVSAQDDEHYSMSQIEGNYYDTSNEYLIMVYHRPPASRFDKLIGWQLLKTE